MKDLAPIVQLEHDVTEDLPQAFLCRGTRVLSIRTRHLPILFLFADSHIHRYILILNFIISTHLPVLVRQDQTHPLPVQGAPEIYCIHSEHSRPLLQLSRLTYDELHLGNGGPRDASSARKGPAYSDSFANILYASERLPK